MTHFPHLLWPCTHSGSKQQISKGCRGIASAYIIEYIMKNFDAIRKESLALNKDAAPCPLALPPLFFNPQKKIATHKCTVFVT